jgi:copper transport protein
MHNHAHVETGPIEPDAAFVHIHSSEAMAEVTIAPNRPGRVRASIRLMDEEFSSFAADDVSLLLTPREPNGNPSISRVATRLPDGTWEVNGLEISQPGVWIVKLTVNANVGNPFVLDASIMIER